MESKNLKRFDASWDRDPVEADRAGRPAYTGSRSGAARLAGRPRLGWCPGSTARQPASRLWPHDHAVSSGSPRISLYLLLLLGLSAGLVLSADSNRLTLPYTPAVSYQLPPGSQNQGAAPVKPASPLPAAGSQTGGAWGSKPIALPPGTGPLDTAAQAAFRAGRFAEAEKNYLEILHQAASNIYVLGNLAATQIEVGKLDESARHLAVALAIDPQDGFCLYLMGRVSHKQGKLDEALDFLNRAATANPESAETQNYLGMVLAEKGQRAGSLAAFRKAVQLQPGYGSAHQNLAFVYATRKPPAFALAHWHYQKALEAGLAKNPALEKLLEEKK
jgi:Flp pilus assembly protein TadD